MNKKGLVIRLTALAVVIAIAATMMVIGRGHTIYFDNKTVENYQGNEYKAFETAVVTVKDEEVAKLGKRERGMATWIGQNFKMTLEITEKKGEEPRIEEIELTLPYNMDGIIINLPAYLAGLPEEAWLSEFIPAPEPEEPEEDLDIGENMGLGEDLSGDTGEDFGV